MPRDQKFISHAGTLDGIHVLQLTLLCRPLRNKQQDFVFFPSLIVELQKQEYFFLQGLQISRVFTNNLEQKYFICRFHTLGI